MDVPAAAIERHTFRDAPSATLSQRWWGLNWADHLPWAVGDITVECASFELISPFFRETSESLFGTPADDRWLADPMTEPKRRFLAEADVFAFMSAGRCVGYLLAHPTDWTTYYFRSLAILPEYRGRGVLAALDRGLAGPLADAGVRRIEGDTGPTNAASLIGHIKLGYVATGLNNTDRWGSLVRYTRHLGDEATNVFRTQFCFDTRPPRRPKSSPRGSGRSIS